MLKPCANLHQQQYEDLRWARRNEQLRRQYEGELIVVHKKQVIAHGHDETQLIEEAADDEHPRSELVVVEILPADFEVPREMH